MELFAGLFFGVWTLVGVVFIIVSVCMGAFRRKKAEQCTDCVTGTVVDVRLRRSQNGGSYHPVVEYMANGEMQHVESLTGRRPAKYRAGERVLVYFDPEKPRRFYIEGDGTAALLEKIFLLVGLGCILIGCIVVLIVLYAA